MKLFCIIKVYKNVDEEKRERQRKNNKCLHDSTNQNLNNTTTFILLDVVLLFYIPFFGLWDLMSGLSTNEKYLSLT